MFDKIKKLIKGAEDATGQHATIKACMMGPRAVGKTTILTAIFHNTSQSIVSRSVVSVAVALLQVMHREMPVWKYIGVVYKAYTTVGDWSRNHPTLYKVLFPSVYIDTAKYPMWHKDVEKHIGYGDSKELAIGKAINMSYTFRIGDSFIEGMKNHTMLNDEVIRNFQDYLCPIPRDKEIKKHISLYVYDSIY